MGTKIPPPPTPPTVPNAEPRNPTTVATTTRRLNARSWGRERERERERERNTISIRDVSTASGTQSEHTKHAQEEEEAKERTAYGPDARRARGQAESHAIVARRRCRRPVRGGEDEAGEDGRAGGPGGDVGEEPPRAAPVKAAVE